VRRLLERLHELAPDHVRLGELERLTEAAEDLDAPVADVDAELDRLQETLVPLADSLLGPTARHLLIPLWRRLSQALQDEPYRAAAPEHHLSHAAAQALDWAGVRQAVEREPQWQSEPVLLLRHARACDQQREFTAALPSWFALCWRFPEQAEVLAGSANHELCERWEAFQDLEPALPVASFPAWLLLSRPGLCRVLRDPNAGPVPCPDSYLTLYRLRCEQVPADAASGSEALTLRARLKQQDPVLFEHFLRALAMSS
jgi:hypothetical protein